MPALHRVLGLEHAEFRRDDAQHDAQVSLGHEAQRREIAGARVVVFEEEPVDFEPVEHRLGDRLVAALGMPALSELPRHRCTVIFMSLGRPASRR